MRRMNFMLSVAAIAVLAAFNPAVAQDSPTFNVSPNVGVDANVGLGNGDQDVWSGLAASAQGDASLSSSGALSDEEKGV